MDDGLEGRYEGLARVIQGAGDRGSRQAGGALIFCNY